MSTNPADVLAYSKAATEGPWEADTHVRGDVVVWGPDGCFISNAQAEPHWLPAPDGSRRQVQFDVDALDATFIANARTDLPALAAFAQDVLVELDTDEHVGMSRDEAIGYNAARELILQLATKHGIAVTA